MLATKLSHLTSTEKRKRKGKKKLQYHLTKKKSWNYLNMTKLFEKKLKRTTKRLNPCRHHDRLPKDTILGVQRNCIPLIKNTFKGQKNSQHGEIED